jgi:hypothetical protein
MGYRLQRQGSPASWPWPQEVVPRAHTHPPRAPVRPGPPAPLRRIKAPRLAEIELEGLRWTADVALVVALVRCVGRPRPVDLDDLPVGRLSILLTLTRALQRELAGPLEVLRGAIEAMDRADWVEVLVESDDESDEEYDSEVESDLEWEGEIPSSGSDWDMGQG